MATSSTGAAMFAATVSPITTSTQPDDQITTSKAWHGSDGFNNPWPSYNPEFSFKAIPFKILWRRLSGNGRVPDTSGPTVPVHTPSFLPSRHGSSNLRATWLGHACYYVEFPSGIRVLFDPVFEERCSPSQWLGPKRFTKQPCKVRDIPTIDAVCISHNHYDHLSLPTITEIAKLHPECHFFVPMGNKAWFKSIGIEKCTELDWWQEAEHTLNPSSDSKLSLESTPAASTTDKLPSGSIQTRFSCVPCQHVGNRGINDRGKTLWSSWVIKSGDKSLYFAGDTGYRTVHQSTEGKDDWGPEYADLPHCPAFTQTGQLRGPFDLGLIPIGAYDPRWLFSSVHSDPRDAVEIFRDTKCKKALAMHWGTWVLTEEDVMEPPQRLKAALKFHNIPETGVFDICDIGESREF